MKPRKEPLVFSPYDEKKTILRYQAYFKKYGHSEMGVGWGHKKKQKLRFDVLASYWSLKNKRILDIGAGFGDLYKFLSPLGIKNYHGFELVSALAEKGKSLYGHNKNFHMTTGNFLKMQLQKKYDVAFISGLFNFKLINGKNYEFIEKVMRKSFLVCQDGLASNFITDRVDYQEPLIFNSNPEKILQIGLKLTSNLVLKNDYFPFEFSIFLNKNQSFNKQDTVFNKFKNEK